MGKVGIFGPGGNPHAKVAPTQYTLVPYHEEKHEEPTPPPMPIPSGGLREETIPTGYTFADPNAVMCTFFLSFHYHGI